MEGRFRPRGLPKPSSSDMLPSLPASATIEALLVSAAIALLASLSARALFIMVGSCLLLALMNQLEI